jgi:DNA-3-methyladenine glycosylase I
VKQRCEWAQGSALALEYHDKEWGVPLHDDTRLFEFLILEGVQAGLSWSTILKKRQGYIKVYDGFDARKIANYDTNKINELLNDSGIIRNRLKVQASIANARGFLDVQKEFGSFDDYIWHFVDGKPKANRWQTLKQIPDKTRESVAMSKDLKKRGFKFVGPTICYAFMQATGMVNDHTLDCFRYHEIINMYPAPRQKY